MQEIEEFSKGLTKSEIKERAANVVKNVLENGNPLQIAEGLSAMEAYIKEIKDSKEFKDYVREETVKHGKTYISPSGAKIEIIEAGTSYDFNNCGDNEIDILESQMVGLKDLIDKRKTFLKNLPIEGIDHLNKATGELEKIFPPSKSSTSSYKITLAK